MQMAGGIPSQVIDMELAAAEQRVKAQERLFKLQQEEMRLIAARQQLAAAIPKGAASAAVDEEMDDGDAFEDDHQCTCLIDDETGNVVVELEGTPIVTISQAGDVLLDTAGWYTDETVAGMNRALKCIQMKVTAKGDVAAGTWFVEYRGKMQRFEDGIRIPAKGTSTASRALAVLASFQRLPVEPVRYEEPAAPSRMEGRHGGGRGGGDDVMRRLSRQGRY